MLYGILADIHGNIYALEAVLSELEKLGVTELLIAGDFVGYYYYPDKVIDLIRNWKHTAVLGNHDILYLKCLSGKLHVDQVPKQYGSGLLRALETISMDNIEWLKNLPFLKSCKLGDTKNLLCHGSPNSNDQYLYPDTEISKFKEFKLRGYDAVIVGHTHYPMFRKCNEVVYFNPGSVGQPRNKNPNAHFGLFDSSNNTFMHNSVEYNTELIINDCDFYDPKLSNLKKYF